MPSALRRPNGHPLAGVCGRARRVSRVAAGDLAGGRRLGWGFVASHLAEQLRRETALSHADIERIHLLLGDWQLLSDLSFADLVLWVHTRSDCWHAVAHVRPNTGQMVFFEDIVGQRAEPDRAELLDRAGESGELCRHEGPLLGHHSAVREEAVPLVHAGRPIAVVTRHTNLSAQRAPSRLELSYQALGNALIGMTARGEWPHPGAVTGARRGAPRVGDGVIHLGPDGVVRYASPNAMSALRRLGHAGEMVGEQLAAVLVALQDEQGPVDVALATVAMGRAAWRTDVATRTGSVALRAIPLTEDGERVGAIILLRDVSELRRRESELLSKDATIREIHHRVKNNLQTVAALLRMQARRLPDGGGRQALDEAVRRVGTIALVHETLSHGFDDTVDFDAVAMRGLHAIVEVARREEPIRAKLTGSFGRMSAEDAMSLALMMSEIIQNAVEHGLQESGGSLEVHASREESADGEGVILHVSITDDGAGIPPGFRPGRAGLGTQIVNSLVQGMHGAIRWEDAEPQGTRVRFFGRLRPLDQEDQEPRDAD